MTYDQPSHSSTFRVLGNLLLNITHDNKLCIQFKLFLLGGILSLVMKICAYNFKCSLPKTQDVFLLHISHKAGQIE